MNKPLIAIVVGGLASIATSRVVNLWQLPSSPSALPAVTLDDQLPSVRYRVQAVLHGPAAVDPDDELNGSLAVAITASAIDATVAGAITLVPIDHPDIPAQTATTLYGHASLTIESWSMCDRDPCIDEYELTITRTGASGVPLTIGGTITATATGDGEKAPGGTSAEVIITGPL